MKALDPRTLPDGTVCCGDASSRGRLCAYHEGYDDGVDSMTPALVCLGRFVAGWEPDDDCWVYRGETTEHLSHGEAERITEAEGAALAAVWASDYFRSASDAEDGA